MEARLIQFLKEELAVTDAAIALMQRQRDFAPNLLPMLLWQYGLINLDELSRVLDWLEAVPQVG